MTDDRPAPPAHLSAEVQAWWLEVVDAFALDSHHLRLLTLCGEAWDRHTEARERLAADGSYFVDRFGQTRQHPAVAVERESARTFARLLRELGLDAESSIPAAPGLRY